MPYGLDPSQPAVRKAKLDGPHIHFVKGLTQKLDVVGKVVTRVLPLQGHQQNAAGSDAIDDAPDHPPANSSLGNWWRRIR